VPFDIKLASQAAKLGKPLAEAGKNGKTVAAIVQLAARIVDTGETAAAETKGDVKSKSLMGKMGLAGLLNKRPAKK
jgi:pilus assembly protein CpaE